MKNICRNLIVRIISIGFVIVIFNCCKINNRKTVSDIDGNIYPTVTIGKFEWMAENLKTTTYNNGTKIPLVTLNNVWISLNTGAYSWYNNNKSNADTFGLLYNWFAVNTGKLCPCGWHIPSDAEWKYLEGYVDTKYGIDNQIWNDQGLRGYDAGLRLKTISGWRIGINGTDSFGFSGIPGGEYLSHFNGKGNSGFWWTSTEFDSSNAWYRNLVYSFAEISRSSHPKRIGFSVRCLRNR